MKVFFQIFVFGLRKLLSEKCIVGSDSFEWNYYQIISDLTLSHEIIKHISLFLRASTLRCTELKYLTKEIQLV